MTTAIRLEHVSKEFKITDYRGLSQLVINAVKGKKRVRSFTAVDDVSFEINIGDTIGLMGLNGSGKSTLLKMICGVMEPSRGKVLTRGRIAGLLEVGAGFHPELTGRENIYLNGSILGMSKTEIERKFDSIVDFSELGHLIDGQVRNYSSGMHSRLAFSVAVHTDCDIFVLDETLAVGDAPFKRKCMRKIMELKNQGLTMFYVGHGRGAVLKLCELGIVLQAGQMAFFGSAKDAVKVLDSGGEEDEMLEAAEEVMA